MAPCLKTLDWSGFLARPLLAPPSARLLEALRQMPMLVIGAGGSIGSALALRLATLEPPALVLLEASENNLYMLRRQCDEAGISARTAFVLGDVADRALLDEIFAAHAPRLVFHAAAFKHVPLLEEQPFAAIQNNVFGAASLAEAAVDARIVLLSTDKAAAPASIMGATKHAAEHIVLAAGGTALRLGNVLASRGSVAEVFAGQIAAGGPLTVTSDAARRYFLTIDESVNLLLAAAIEPESPAVLAPALPAPHPVTHLARFMAQSLAPGGDIPVVFTGPRPGDKESEQFWSDGEEVRTAGSAGLLIVESPFLTGEPLRRALVELRAAVDARDLPAAIAGLRRLAPDYTPSLTLLALADRQNLPESTLSGLRVRA